MPDRLRPLAPYDGPEIPPERAAVPYYRLLVHAPPLIVHWYQWVEGLRWDVEAPRHYREMALLRTVQLVGGAPAWSYHAPGAGEFGITDEQIADLKRWPESDHFDDRERAVLRCCDEVHEHALSEDAFAELQRHFSDREVVEIVVTTAFYQCVPRVMQGLGVAVEPERTDSVELM
jgi:alkylhydroperoxidase family enzyme